jgi:hypothetical protein
MHAGEGMVVASSSSAEYHPSHPFAHTKCALRLIFEKFPKHSPPHAKTKRRIPKFFAAGVLGKTFGQNIRNRNELCSSQVKTRIPELVTKGSLVVLA